MSGNFLATGTNLDYKTLSISSLAHLCRKSTDQFFQGLDNDDEPCFELFRRAIEDQNNSSWDILIAQYTHLVISWVQRHPYFPKADEETDYFVNRTFDKFWHAFNRNPQKLQKFDNVRSILGYMKLCTNSAVKEYVERRMEPQGVFLSNQPIETLSIANDPIQSVEEKLSATRLWRYILSVTKSEEERVIAEEYFIYDLKPREIQSRHHELFSTAGEVSRVKENLMARLRRDDQLAAFFSAGD